MPYGTIKIDTITFTDAGVDKSIAVSGFVQNPTFTGNVTVTGTISGTTVRATTVSGVTVSGTTANFASGVYTTQISGAVVKVPAGTPGAPPLQVGTGASVAPGFYSPATDQLGISTGGTFRLVVDSTGRVGIGTASPGATLHAVSADNATTGLISGATNAIRLVGNNTGVGGGAIEGVNATASAFAPLLVGGSDLRVAISGTERARIDSSGRLLVGTSSALTTFFGTAVDKLAIAGGAAPQVIGCYVNNQFGARLDFVKSRSGTVNGQTVVQLNDTLGEIYFGGSDGTTPIPAARVYAEVDGTPGANDMPGRLVFSTTADGAASPTERMRIDSSGRVGIGTTSPATKLHVLDSTAIDVEVRAGNSASFMSMLVDSTGVGKLVAPGGTMTFTTSAFERARIDSSGRLLVGTSSAISSFYGTFPTRLSISTGPACQLIETVGAAHTFGSRIDLYKTRGATSGSAGIVQNNDEYGSFVFGGSDGANPIPAAAIFAQVDGTPGANDMPGRLVFSTTADGAASPTERMRIDSSGRVGIGTASPSTLLQCQQASAGTVGTFNFTSSTGGGAEIRVANGYSGTVPIYSFWFNNTTGIGNPAANEISAIISGTERARIDSSGRLLVGTSTNIANGLVQFGQNTGTAGTTVQAISSNATAGYWLARSNANAIVASGDIVGSLDFRGYDGAAYHSLGAIRGEVGGTPGLNDMPGRLVFSTTADGASGPTERMRIDSAGNVGIGGTPGSYKLDVQGGGQRILNQGATSFLEIGNGTATSQTAFIDLTTDTTYTDYGLRLIRDGAAGANGVSQLAQRGTGELSLRCIEAAPLTFYTTNTERARIDSSGRLLVGTSSSITGVFGNAAAVQFNASFGTQTLALTRFSANNFGADIDFLKSRNATVGAHTIVQSGDQIANLNFAGSDGTAFVAAAGISANIDGTPGANDMPGRLVFSTTADGAASPTERMRIDSGGRIGIGGGAGTDTAFALVGVARGPGTGNYGYRNLLEIPSTTTSSYTSFESNCSTAASAFTLANFVHYDAVQGTFGAGSTVTNQYAFFARAGLIGATNNFGFYSNITAATGRWNFYCNGTADSYFNSNNFIFANGGTERARFDPSGRLLVGTSSARTSFFGGTVTPVIQLEQSSLATVLSVVRNSADNADPIITLCKTRGTANGSNTIVAADDFLGGITFQGADGVSLFNAATIRVNVDGTPGVGDMPGRLVFSTTTDGTTVATERLRITNDGVRAYNQPAPAAVNATATLTVANLKAGIITSTSAAATDMTLPTGTDTQAGFSGTYDNFTFEWSVINTGPSLVRVLAGTAHTVVGSGSVATGTSGRFASRRTAANTFVTYRLA